MQKVTKEDVERQVLDIAKSFRGKNSVILPSDYLGADAGIVGGDSVEFLDEVEARFGVDLKPLVERGPPPRRQPWWTWISGTPITKTGVDVTVNELVDYIVAHSD